ncbi:hypothetical protein ACQGAO_18700 [Rhodococcus sp. 1.20]
MKINRRLAGFAALPAVATLLLAGCGSSDAAPSTETRSADQSWSYTTGYGNTITLDHAPERIVVDAYSAAALWTTAFGRSASSVTASAIQTSPIALTSRR